MTDLLPPHLTGHGVNNFASRVARLVKESVHSRPDLANLGQREDPRGHKVFGFGGGRATGLERVDRCGGVRLELGIDTRKVQMEKGSPGLG